MVTRPCACSMRMYGCEKIEVVKPTKAVSATRKTLNESTRKSLPATSIGPAEITWTVSAAAASSVNPQTTTLTHGASSRSPMSASTSAPTSGMPRTARISIMRQRRSRAGANPSAAERRKVLSFARTTQSPRWPSPSLFLLELLEVLEVEAVELLADLEEEDTEDEHADQHVQRDAQLHHHRHAVGRAGRREQQAVL